MRLDKYSYRDIVNSRSLAKKNIDKQDLWVFLVVRPISFIVTWCLMRLNITANQATFISTVISIVGGIMLVTKSFSQGLVALIILNFWIIFDCVDGNIARTTHKSSIFGEFLDGLSGYIFTISLYFFLSINIYLNSTVEYRSFFLILGGVTSMATIFPRLVEHKAVNMFRGYKKDVTDRKNYSLFYIVGLNIAGMAGFSNPAMIVMYLFGRLDWYLIFYCIIHCGIAALSIIKILRKVSQLGV